MANNSLTRTEGPMPHTRAIVSSRSRVFAINPTDTKGGNISPDQLVGTISSFGITSTKNVEAIRGIGLGDHIVEMVPGQSEPVELQVTKFLMGLENIHQAFGYTGGVDGIVRALKHHRYPVDIKHEILVSTVAESTVANNSTLSNPTVINNGPSTGGDISNYKAFANRDSLQLFKAIVTWYEGCWFTSFSVTYGSDASAITEDASIVVTDVSGHPQGTILIPNNDYITSGIPSRIWNKI